VCQDVCPWNVKFASATNDPGLAPRPGLARPEIEELGAIEDAEFAQRYGDTALARAGAAGLRRNVAALRERKRQ